MRLLLERVAARSGVNVSILRSAGHFNTYAPRTSPLAITANPR